MRNGEKYLYSERKTGAITGPEERILNGLSRNGCAVENLRKKYLMRSGRCFFLRNRPSSPQENVTKEPSPCHAGVDRYAHAS